MQRAAQRLRRMLGGILFLICLASWALPANASNMDDVGFLTFPTSGAPEAQEHFLRGVAILHSFGWKQARTEFQAAQKLDPDFAMAYWGESLTYNHPLISEMDLDTPRAVLSKLGSTSEERRSRLEVRRSSWTPQRLGSLQPTAS